MPSPEMLADFQAALLELLSQDLPADVIQQRLRDDPAFEGYREYVKGFDPAMIVVASALTKQWGRRIGGS